MESGTPSTGLQDTLARQMIEAGAMFHRRGWVPATGGNFSARLASDRVLITASGIHKGELKPGDFLVADMHGRPLEAGRKASYETGLHMQAYRFNPSIGSVLHVHSIANTVLSRRLDRIVLTGYELQKILPGAPDPAATVEIPVFGNDQDIARLSAEVDAHMKQKQEEQRQVPAYLIAGHGLYAWGDNVAQARHRVEALEFMFECELWSGRLSK
jgi:methylthioribulose-1-phosphate dehydratase